MNERQTIVLAFDSYKGSLTAVEACEAAAQGAARLRPVPPIIQCPLSDGGEGFAESLRLAARGTSEQAEITGPLFERRAAELVFLDGGRTAVIECAQACGLGLVPPAQRSPLCTTTYGLGELLGLAVSRGAKRAVVGLGGSSTNDGGMGLMAALGWRFWDVAGKPLEPVGASLLKVQSITRGRIPAIEIVAACDVTNPLFGASGAARVFAPQKGASPADVEVLDRGLQHFAGVCARELGIDASHHAGAGAAGGAGFALLAFLGAKFISGATLAIELSGLSASLADAALCFTGEGQTDGQTVCGKLPAAVSACCQAAGVPCVCLSGSLGADWRSLYQQGMTAVLSISQRPQDLPQAIAAAPQALADTVEAICRMAGQFRQPAIP